MIRTTVNREQELENIERQERDARRQEAKELQEHYKLSKNDEANEKKKIDELTKQEEEKQWRIKEGHWKQEQDARVNLMREVYESRATHIEHKKRLHSDAKDAVRRDMDDLKRELTEQERLAEEKRLAQ